MYQYLPSYMQFPSLPWITGVFLYHLILTSPSCIWHGIINLYQRVLYISHRNIPVSTIEPSILEPILQHEKVVIFVHGRGGHHTNFIPLVYNLINHYKLSGYYFGKANLGWNSSTSVDEDVKKLSRELDKYIDCEITLVGMSKGGVVCARYATTQNDIRIKRVITISAPLRGTLATKFLGTNSVTNRELGYHSDLTETIAAEIAKIAIPIHHVVPKWDHLIIPTANAEYDSTPETNIFYYQGYYSHVGIPHSPEIASKIANWITS